MPPLLVNPVGLVKRSVAAYPDEPSRVKLSLVPAFVSPPSVTVVAASSARTGSPTCTTPVLASVPVTVRLLPPSPVPSRALSLLSTSNVALLLKPPATVRVALSWMPTVPVLVLAASIVPVAPFWI